MTDEKEELLIWDHDLRLYESKDGKIRYVEDPDRPGYWVWWQRLPSGEWERVHKP